MAREMRRRMSARWQNEMVVEEKIAHRSVHLFALTD
jgi:hypothetical protein